LASEPIAAFAAAASRIAGRDLSGYDALHRWSVDDRKAFWSLVWDHCGVIGDKGARIVVDGDRMPGAAFFPDASLNFAENLLRGDGPQDAIVFRGEDKVAKRLSRAELNAMVSRLQQEFAAVGIKPGDRVAAMMPNMLSAKPHIQSGRLRAMGVTGSKRAPGADDIPTIAEAGVPGYEAVQWYGVLAPAKTPAAIIGKLHAGVVRALQNPEVRKRLNGDGAEAVGSSPAEFAAYIRAETEKWARVIKAAGINPG